MKLMSQASRRAFLLNATALAASAPFWHPTSLSAQTSAPRAAPLPQRGEVLIRGGYVMTMDPARGDVANGDIHVRNGAIVAVGSGLIAPSAEVIDGTDMIVVPGLIETHWHMWNTLLRSMAVNEQKYGYFPTSMGLGKFYLPSDMYQGARLSAAEAINAGITFAHDWCHNPLTPEHAEEDLRALYESGIRARFSYGPARGMPLTQPINLKDIERLNASWPSYSNEGLISLGIAWRGVQYAMVGEGGKMTFQPIPQEVYQREYDTARKLNIPLSVHVNIGPKIDFGHVIALAKLNLLYPDLQLIHMISSTPEEIDMVAAAGCSVSFSPYTEMRTGFGFPQPDLYLDKGIRVGLSVDTTTLSGDANLFEIMKGIQNIANAEAFSEFKMSARKALELGTLMGAKSMGIANQVGSLTAGKRGDLIMISTTDINMGMFTDPAQLVVGAAQPSNVQLVMVDGRILKRNGKLVHLDTKQIVAESAAANAALRKRAGWW
jgi:5-methylthioadenosine/S-adenosylhomocysteine deaminase